MACVAVYWLTPADSINAILYVNPLVRLIDFYWGMLLCHYFLQRKDASCGRWLEIVLVIVLILFLAAYPFADEKLRNAPLYWLALIPLIWVFAQQRGSVSRWLKTKPLLFLGSLTMPIFLTHQLLIGILLRRLPELPAVPMLAVCIFVVLMISWTIQIIFSRLIR